MIAGMAVGRNWRRGLLLLLLMPWVVSVTASAEMGEIGTTRSCGIGLDDRHRHSEYPLKLVFADRKGPFLGQIDVTIFDPAGKKVLEAFSPGPWLYVNLPPGSYRVLARRPNGDGSSATVTLGGERRSVLNLTWVVKS